ncbi:peptidyl-prolyl cis-trans isomerase [Sphingorhabdus lutea]|nr:peptidylprolyl isomerase [Sphingorhabdus lutea]
MPNWAIAHKDKIKSWANEPLLHFMILGLLIFFILGGSNDVSPEDRKIEVTEEKATILAQGFAATMGRPASRDEVDMLIRDYIREEIYYREALRLGLDQDDPIVRRRMRAKMEVLVMEAAEDKRPTNSQLQAFYNENKAKYQNGPFWDFQQILLGKNDDAASIIAQLNGGVEPNKVGQRTSLRGKINGADPANINREFGEAFADQLAKLPHGKWSGPVQSGFGDHVIFIAKQSPPYSPPISQIEARLIDDWQSKYINERKEKAYQALLNGYDVKIAPLK